MAQSCRAAALVCILLSTTLAHGQASLPRLLDAGEYSLALEHALSQSDAVARDEALLEVAEAQQQAGAAQAARFTLSHIEDDLVRQRGAMHQQFGLNGAPNGGDNGGFGNPNTGGVRGGGGQLGNGGGAAQADFDTLIDLITTTVEPDTWEELGGEGAINGFPGGVYVDAAGLVTLAPNPRAELATDNTAHGDWARISLPRLEKALQLAMFAGEPLTAELLTLGGLSRIESITVHADSGDLVIAGPTTPHLDQALRLEDLLVVMHHVFHADQPFGCSIDPRPNNLAQTQRFLDTSSQTPLRPGARSAWADQIEQRLGRQEVSVFGIDPDTTTAMALVEADYHMKLIGIGKVDGGPGVPSYLELIEQPGSLDLVRWWFMLGYDGIETNPERNSFKFLGHPVKLVSETEMLAARGQRVPTGNTSPLNRQFTEAFTQQLDQLALEYPVYARLKGIFQFASLAQVLRQEQLPNRVGWQPTLLVSGEHPLIERTPIPREVQTVVNHKVIDGNQIVLMASGGVRVVPSQLQHRVGNTAQLSQAAAANAPQHRRGAAERWSW